MIELHAWFLVEEYWPLHVALLVGHFVVPRVLDLVYP